MGRVKRILHSWKPAMAEEEITETFTHVCRLPGGSTLRGVPEEGFWFNGGASWYGVPPAGWDDALAVPEKFTRQYIEEADYS
jgi:hypothetical protein